MRIAEDIFKAYDVRGLYPGEINEDAARQIGRAFVTYLGATRIGVSRDMRLSSPSVAAAFIEGARMQGAHVIDYGMCGTDMIYFAVVRDGLDGGAQITASHNPKEYNGIKMVRQEAFPLSGDAGIGDIRDMITAGALPAPAAVRGGLETRNILDAYVDKVMSFIDPAAIQPFKVVLDAGSGMAGLVAPRLFDRLPCTTTRLCFEIDGTFPNHEANPLIEENRRDIVERVVAEGADIGIAWDGDADRCFFIDGSGEFIAGDFVTALLAEAALIKQPGQTIIYDVRASYAVKDVVARYHGRALMNRVGHAFIKRRMREEDAVFGGEVTGHYYFRDFYYADNGFIPALLILELMSRKGMTLRDLLAPLREKYFISGEINTRVGDMAQVDGRLRALAARYADAHTYTLDGFSAEYPDWHFNVRGSNTEPMLRVNLEAVTPALMAEKRDEVLAIRGLSIVVMSWLPKPVRRVRFP
jgi:phosphomannomutase